MGEHVPRWLIHVGKKGGADIGKTKRGTGSKCMVVVDGAGVPLGIHVASASLAEIALTPATLNAIRVPGRGRAWRKPVRVIADRAYASDPFRAAQAKRGTVVIVPYRKNNLHRRHEDGRLLRRYRHRWIVERTFAWLGGFRRLLVRHERRTSMFLAFLHLAAALITLRRF